MVEGPLVALRCGRRPLRGGRQVVQGGAEVSAREAGLAVRSRPPGGGFGGEGGGFPAEGLEHAGDKVAPPGVFGGVAERVQGVVGRKGGGEDGAEGGVHAGRIDLKARGRGEVAGVDLAHGFGGTNEGAGGVEEDRHGGRGRSGGRMSGGGGHRGRMRT